MSIAMNALRYARCAVPAATRALSTAAFGADDLSTRVAAIVSREFPIHPFKNGVRLDNEKKVLAHYTAMSQAFPYIQAGAFSNVISKCLHRHERLTQEDEATLTVGAFLAFDETAGLSLLLTQGKRALPKLLSDERVSHASLLRRDVKVIVGEEVFPDFGHPTYVYLSRLLDDLGSADHCLRVASMVAFELHAGEMIQALWDNLVNRHQHLNKDSLEYFRLHVGGDDPQEEYHKQLTKRLVDICIKPAQHNVFIRMFRECYRSNSNWCENICKLR